MSGDVCTGGIDTGFVELGYAKIAVLGVVQGLTELLPISSTAHMRIVPALLGWRDPGSAFSAAMQAAALVAVISYFWADVKQIAVGSTRAILRRDFTSRDLTFVYWIILASLPIVVAGAFLSKTLNACGTPLRSLPVIGIACITIGFLLAIAEKYCNHTRRISDMKLKDAMIVGLAQAGALIPGVSRSGSTLTAALFRDLNREDAARYSFLLGLLVIAAAGLKEFHELYKAHISSEAWLMLLFGLVIASISAFAAIWSLLRILEKFASWPFVYYRIFIGVVLLVGAAIGWLH